MRRLRWLLFRLTALLRRKPHEADLDAELQFHLDAETDEGTADGLTTAEAQHAAKRRLGNIALTKEDTRRAWQWTWLEELTQDLRYAVRVLRRRPGFTATALLSLMLGLGANTALFSLLDNLLWKPLPVERPHELVRLNDNGETVRYSVYDQLRRESRTLSSVAVMTDVSTPEIEYGGKKTRTPFQMVSDDYFQVLGVSADRGRVFRAPASGTASEPAAVISHDLWQRTFDGDLSALGSRFRYGKFEFTIIGIAPSGFHGANIDVPADIWVPFDVVVPADDDDRIRGRWTQVIGRLRQGETPSSAAAEASAILDRAVQFKPGAVGFSNLRDRLSQPLLLLGLITTLVLLITCANLANLALAGAAARDRELAVRQAIGASRSRVARQLLTESLVLAVAGAALALLVAPWMSAALLSFLPPAQTPALMSLSFVFNLRILAFITLLSLSTCLLIGLIPALKGTRRHVTSAIKIGSGSGQRARNWTSQGLIVMEVAMCTVLLVTAGVFMRTIQNLRSQDTGYRETQLLVADVQPPRRHSEIQRDRLLDALVERARTLPGVETAAFTRSGQLSGSGLEYPVTIPGVPKLPADDASVFEQRISPGFLAAMGTRFVAGRDFADRDDDNAPDVAIVNQAFASRYFPGTDPIGKRFIRERPEPRPFLVVGVVNNSKWINLRAEAPAMYYIPYRQQPGSPAVQLAIRANADLDALGAQLVQAAQALDPELQISNVVPFSEIVNRTLVIERLITHVSTAFASLGLLIAAIGLYGILAYAVVRRTREIGIRIAMGATPGTVEWMFVRESLALLVAGFAIGLPAAVLVMQSVSAMLFGLQPGDPMTMAVTLATLTAAALAAAYLPARRAASIDPIRALREE